MLIPCSKNISSWVFGWWTISNIAFIVTRKLMYEYTVDNNEFFSGIIHYFISIFCTKQFQNISREMVLTITLMTRHTLVTFKGLRLTYCVYHSDLTHSREGFIKTEADLVTLCSSCIFSKWEADCFKYSRKWIIVSSIKYCTALFRRHSSGDLTIVVYQMVKLEYIHVSELRSSQRSRQP